MARAFEDAERRGHAAVQIDVRAGRNPRPKAGCVEFVLGMQGERHVHRVPNHVLGLFAEQHPQEVRRRRQIGPGRDGLLAFTQTGARCDHRWHLAEQALGLGAGGPGVHRFGLTVIVSKQGDAAAQRRERVGVGRHHAQVVDDDVRHGTAGGEPLRKRVELLAIREVTLP